MASIEESPLTKPDINQSPIDLDVIIVGAGFSGISSIYRLRKLGLRVKIFEEGSDIGGVWFWNRYPGARVDSEHPFYQLSIPEVYKTFNFNQRFPSRKELMRYMNHLDDVLHIRQDTFLNARVCHAQFDTESGRWKIKTAAGHIATGKYLILGSGLLNREHKPDFPGLSNFQGPVYHSRSWPESADVVGKKVALIGAGATSIQILQEVAKQASHLTLFMRRPSYCLPICQYDVTDDMEAEYKIRYEQMFEESRLSFSGFPGSPDTRSVLDVDVEERERVFEETFSKGGFSFVMTTFPDLSINEKSNRIFYDFWAKKTRQRIKDPVKRDLMAPLEPPYFFATKRVPLERDYYECIDMPHVEVVSLVQTPFENFHDKGIVCSDGKDREIEVVILATGFDSFSGSVTSMGLKNVDGVDIKELWAERIETYLGVFVHGFPNMFMLYSPQAPTTLSNGPTIIEAQADFITTTIALAEASKIRYIEPSQEAVNEWGDLVTKQAEATLLPRTASWWTGGPGRRPQMLTYTNGIPEYKKTCLGKLDGWQGFEITSEQPIASMAGSVG